MALVTLMEVAVVEPMASAVVTDSVSVVYPQLPRMLKVCWPASRVLLVSSFYLKMVLGLTL